MRSVITRAVTPKKEVVAAVASRFDTVPFVAWKFVAKKLVEVVFVPVAFVQTKLVTVPFVAWRLVVNKLVEVTPVWNTNPAVDVPPANWIVLVVALPLFVTVWNVGLDEAGQLVPFERQTV
jgi:hypothetical protein